MGGKRRQIADELVDRSAEILASDALDRRLPYIVGDDRRGIRHAADALAARDHLLRFEAFEHGPDGRDGDVVADLPANLGRAGLDQAVDGFGDLTLARR